MATAQTQAPTPQLEARLGHSLPFTSDLVVGCGESVVARVFGRVYISRDYRTDQDVYSG